MFVIAYIIIKMLEGYIRNFIIFTHRAVRLIWEYAGQGPFTVCLSRFCVFPSA